MKYRYGYICSPWKIVCCISPAHRNYGFIYSYRSNGGGCSLGSCTSSRSFLYYFTGQTVQILSPRPPISFPVGTNVTFQCEATGFVFARWKVNATQLAGQLTRGAFANRGIITEPPPMLQEIGNISYTLYALASFENNRTVITCRASMNLTSPYVSSDGVTLLVFGECFYKMSCSNLTSHKSPFPDFSGRAGDEAKPHHLPFRSKFLLY